MNPVEQSYERYDGPDLRRTVRHGHRILVRVWTYTLCLFIVAHGVYLGLLFEHTDNFWEVMAFVSAAIVCLPLWCFVPVRLCILFINPSVQHWHPPFSQCCGCPVPYRVQRPLRWLLKRHRVAVAFVTMFLGNAMMLSVLGVDILQAHAHIGYIVLSATLLISWLIYLSIFRQYQWQWAYSEWCTLLNDAAIRWVKVEALRRWEQTKQPIPRMQDLAPGDYVDHAFGAWEKDRHRFVVSHAWLGKGEPDPTREQLATIVSELDRLEAPDSDLVFYDHASIPQHPRTEDETRRFKIALKGMNLLYTFETTRVLVIPNVSSKAPNPTPYSKRGWCFFELAISSAFDTIVNFRSPAVQKVLALDRLPVSTAAFVTAFANKEFTVQGDRSTVEALYSSLYKKVMYTDQQKRFTVYMSIAVIQAAVCTYVDVRFLTETEWWHQLVL